MELAAQHLAPSGRVAAAHAEGLPPPSLSALLLPRLRARLARGFF